MWRRREEGGFLFFFRQRGAIAFTFTPSFVLQDRWKAFSNPPQKNLIIIIIAFFSNKLVSERLQKEDFYQSKGTFLICTSPHRVLDPTTQPGK